MVIVNWTLASKRMAGIPALLILAIACNIITEIAGNECPPENPPIDVLFPHETDCTKFYKCDNGIKIEQDCPENLHYNPITEQCDWPEASNCSNGNMDLHPLKPDPLNVYDEISHYECPLENPSVDILLPHESNCSKFYMCDSGVKVEFDCPKGLNFNSFARKCDWPGTANCVNSNDLLDTPDDECPLENSDKDIFFPHKTNCSKFYECSHGIKVEFDCPEGLHFNSKTEQCDWPENVECNATEESIPIQAVFETFNVIASNILGGQKREFRKECPLEYPSENLDIYLLHESDCTKFYVCDNGIAVEFECPEMLHFNLDTKQCDWPENVNCELN